MRLLLDKPGREDRAAYEARGGYRPGLAGADLVAAVTGSGLRGRGGAAYPAGRKLTAVRQQPGDHVLVVNGEEGEPASIKDRWLLRYRPHLVLDGALRAAEAIGAAIAYVYVSEAESATSVARALTELGDLPVRVLVHSVEPSYVAGEETAAVRAINGGPAKPTDKPPRPYQRGVAGLPTLVSNVETIANLPRIAAGERPDTVLVTLGGDCPRPGLHEVAFGTTIGQLTGTDAAPRGYLMGGYFAGLLNGRGHELELDYDALAAAGTALGCGSISVLGPADCPVGRAAAVLAYFDRGNSGQCGACFNGTAAMSGVLSALAHGAAAEPDVERLRTWTRTLPGRGACGTVDGAANVARTLLREFPADVDGHLGARCPACARIDFAAELAPFAREPKELVAS